VEETTPLHAWKETFKKVITNTASHYVFIVDALDECLDSSEVEKLLDFMGDVLRKHANVSFLCSSHRQINMGDYFDRNMLLPTDVTVERTAEQVERFVREEIQRRRLKANNSIFCKSAES
jgi:ABC-type Mn2+/Zn2+ transport system ATPase subunit